MTVRPQPPDGLLAGLQAGLRRTVPRGAKVLLAVSGGTDSTALLHGAAALAPGLGLSLLVGCVDHGLRPGSAEEARSVGAQAAGLGLPFKSERVELADGPALEARARQARYRALEGLREALGAGWIATAHTADDQAETLLMRLLRGSATRGARGILPIVGPVVRPMLEVTRDEVRAFLEARGLEAVRDPMNRDPRFLRVRVREGLLPVIRSLGGPEAVRHLAAFAAQAERDEALLLEEAEAARARLELEGGLEAVGLRALPAALRMRVLRGFLEEAGLESAEALLERADRAVREGRSVELLRGVRLACEGGRVRLPKMTTPFTPVSLAEGGRVRLGPLEVGLSGAPPPGAWAVPIPPSALPLWLRPRRPGDRLQHRAGEKKLQDLFVDLKVPRELREGHPVAVSATGEVLALVPLWPKGNAPPGGGVYLWAIEVA